MILQAWLDAPERRLGRAPVSTRSRRAGDSAVAASIDDVDVARHARRLDWHDDPWDELARRRRGRAAAAPDPHRSSGSAIAALVLVDRARSSPAGHRLVVHPPDQPRGRAGRAGRASRSTDGETLRVGQRAARGQGLDRRRRLLPLVRRATTAGSTSTPGLLRASPRSDHMGNVLGRAAHAAERDVHEGDVPRGLHRRRRWRARLADEIVPMRRPDFIAAAARPDDRRRCFRPPGVTRSRGCCSPTRTRCPTARARPRCIERMIGADGARRQAGGHRRAKAPRAARPDPVRHPDHRLDDRARGEDRRGPADDRPGDLQPPGASACRSGSMPPCSTDVPRGVRRRTSRVRSSCAPSTRRGTRTCTSGCRRRRSPTPGGRRSRRR